MKIGIICFLMCLAFGCNAAKPVAENTKPAAETANFEKRQTAIAHSSEDQTSKPVAPPTGEKSKWTQGGDPIETKELDASIMTAEKTLRTKPADAAAKKALGDAFYKRAVALTGARQYASALGDYRRTLKYDPANAEAKDWIDRIVMIYDGLRKESPKDGEEPPPLPFKKD